MKKYETLHMFVRATRQELLDLHITSIEELTKYLFAHDQLTYARVTPVFLAECTN